MNEYHRMQELAGSHAIKKEEEEENGRIMAVT